MKVLDYRGLTKLWDRAKSYFARLNLTYGTRGYITGAGSNPDILLEKIKLGLIQLYQGTGVSIKLYEYDANNEENATLVWDSSTLTGDTLTKFINGENLGTIYTSTAGKCVKAIYDGHTGGSYYYIRAFGIFMTPKQADNSHTASAVCTINNTAYQTYTVDTYGGLVTAVCPDGNYTTCTVRFTPSAETTRMRFYGFRCLNTYDGTEAVLIGRASSANTAIKPVTTLLTSSNDLNDIKGSNTGDVLWYRWTNSSYPSNVPRTNTTSVMQVVRDHSGNYCTQEVYLASVDEVSIRICNNGTWGSWFTYSKSDHTHGNITNAGALQTTDVAIANGDKLVITDSSDSNKIARSSATFDGTTISKALTQAGTFEGVMLASDAMSLSGGDGVDISYANNAATLSANITSIPTSVIDALT